jgi:tRNA(fMet)-specific endonuclease VapC
MRNCLLDTNILLYYLRQDVTWYKIQHQYKLDKTNNFISIINIGELWSIGIRNQWGERRIKELENISTQFTMVDINVESIIKCYGEIDAYSQGKLKDKPLSHSARNMGKNDIWLAAMASVLDLRLITTDLDFTHLDKVYLDLQLVDIQKLV